MNKTIQYLSLFKLAASLGMLFDIDIIWRKDKLIIMFVEVPKPLSISQLGTTSLMATGVTHKITPHEKPRISLAKQITQKLRMIERQEPTIPKIFMLMITFLRPDLTKWPPKMEPIVMPRMHED